MDDVAVYYNDSIIHQQTNSAKNANVYIAIDIHI